MSPEYLPEPCPGCGEHHEVPDGEATQTTYMEGPFAAVLFVRPDGDWTIQTALPHLDTLAAFHAALREASAELS